MEPLGTVGTHGDYKRTMGVNLHNTFEFFEIIGDHITPR